MQNPWTTDMPQSRRLPAALFGATILAIASTATAQTPDQPRSASAERLAACRAIADTSARLVCFDRESAALEAAERSGAVVIVDQEQVREARRRRFGFTMPSLPMFEFGGGAEVDNVSSTLRTATQNGFGVWTFVLEDGSVWRQSDSERVTARLRPGAPVVVRKAAFGSFLMNVNDAPAIRVNRRQ